jgi:hypothetical protein
MAGWPESAARPSQTWAWYWFRVVIGLGNGMKRRVLLELTEANGSVQTRELVTGSQPIDASSAQRRPSRPWSNADDARDGAERRSRRSTLSG